MHKKKQLFVVCKGMYVTLFGSNNLTFKLAVCMHAKYIGGGKYKTVKVAVQYLHVKYSK